MGIQSNTLKQIYRISCLIRCMPVSTDSSCSSMPLASYAINTSLNISLNICAVFPQKCFCSFGSNECNTSSRSQQKHPTIRVLTQNPWVGSCILPLLVPCSFLRTSFGIIIDLHTSEKVWGLRLTIVKCIWLVTDGLW